MFLIYLAPIVFKVGFPGGADGKASACNAGDLGSIPGSGRSLEKEMATHSSILPWRIPWMEEPGRLQSTGVAKSWTQLSNFTFTFIVFKNYHHYKNLLSGIQRVNNLTSLCQPILFYFSKFFSTKPWHNSGLDALVFCIIWAISFHVSHSVSDCGFFFKLKSKHKF